jgi:hypothetical protein
MSRILSLRIQRVNDCSKQKSSESSDLAPMRVRDRRTAAARKLIVTLGVERWRQSRTGLARVLEKNPDMVSFWAGEGAKSRVNNPEYAAELDRLDEGLAAKAAKMTSWERLGETF